MEREEILRELYEWDFKNKSKKQFAAEFRISVKTVDRYIERYNIPYVKRVFGIKKGRDRYGKFVLENQELEGGRTETRTKSASFAMCPVTSFKAMNDKYKHYFT